MYLLLLLQSDCLSFPYFLHMMHPRLCKFVGYTILLLNDLKKVASIYSLIDNIKVPYISFWDARRDELIDCVQEVAMKLQSQHVVCS